MPYFSVCYLREGRLLSAIIIPQYIASSLSLNNWDNQRKGQVIGLNHYARNNYMCAALWLHIP